MTSGAFAIASARLGAANMAEAMAAMYAQRGSFD